MKSRFHETINGHRIEYPEPDAALARFLSMVEKLAADAAAGEDDLVALVYSSANPLLTPSPLGGAPLVTKEVLGSPVYRVLTDLLERKRIAARGIDVEKLAAGYKLTVTEAAARLGVHESAVRQAVAAWRLAAWVKDGRIYLHPKWLDQFARAQAELGKRGPKTKPVRQPRTRGGAVPKVRAG